MKLLRVGLLMIASIAGNPAAQAQGHTVLVRAALDNPGPSAGVVEAVRSKIVANPRYSVTKTIVGTELVLSIACANQPSGYACSYHIAFYSPKTAPLSLAPKVGIVSGQTIEKVTDRLYESFVDNSTDDRIHSAIRLQLDLVAAFCKRETNRDYCRSTNQ